ncbi:YnbE family lipoprotein [Malikia sp.]|uniref:YnbE family lipoprotein n=1 Tax=Malikia sp. TaxID=2070706 RepID=UPI0026144B19|nr:YnbE family lipoprotein [Malikia sp.]MDD2728556.1 YnbE family lipoprotein [Malikia sp.]
MNKYLHITWMAVLPILVLEACSPTVKLQAPDKPIEINMNVNIKHEILLKVEKDVQQLFQSDKGLF